MKHQSRTVAFFTFTRTILNTSHRMVYPFLGFFQDGLGVSLASLSLVLTIKSLIGACGPLLATLADTKSRKTGMLLGLTIFIIGAFIVSIFPTFPVFIAAVLLTVLGKYIFDPSMHAYLGDRIIYEKRGRIMAISEYSWSLSFILGVPLVGYLMNRFGWIAPFPTFFIFGIILLGILSIAIPDIKLSNPNSHFTFDNLRLVFHNRLAVAGVLMSTLFSMANEVFTLVFGIWLEDSFGLRILALGIASSLIGFAEFGGESFVAAFVDRLGKSRTIFFGIILNCVASLAILWISHNLIGALVGLVLFYITFEIALVSSIPMMSELLPGSRATMISSTAAAHSLGRALGALLASPLYMLGIHANILTVILCNSLGLITLVWLMKHSQKQL